jgi:DNA-binding winged helix-turn-helix (wHTH) protein
MNYLFGAFELDQDRRELRLNGDAIGLHPRIFDLLIYLVRQQHRVVGKDELLEQLWPGVIVTESSLQRAVSLARSALRQGGLENAIRTVARQGYRFCAEVSSISSPIPGAVGTGSPAALQQAHQHCAEYAWEAAAEAFQQADRKQPLAAEDLERWADAIQCAARLPDAIAPLERALAAYGSSANPYGAARVSLMLAQIHLYRLANTVAKGWYQRAARYLHGTTEAREHALLACFASLLAEQAGDERDMLAHARQAHAIGGRLADPDIEAQALMLQGRALLLADELRRGGDLLDEAAAMIFAGNTHPLSGGAVYCGVIFGCRHICDWQRARQWTDEFKRWCEHTRVDSFSAHCRLYRAEVLSISGELAEAEREINSACQSLAVAAPWDEGDAYRILGDLQLARGHLEDAATAYQRAQVLGWDPQPGYALLLLTLGKAGQALHSLEQSLDASPRANRRQRGLLLTHMVIAATAAGQLERAWAAFDELDQQPELWLTPALAAYRAQAWAELGFAEAQIDAAIAALRNALEQWQRLDAPLHVAGTKLRRSRRRSRRRRGGGSLGSS